MVVFMRIGVSEGEYCLFRGVGDALLEFGSCLMDLVAFVLQAGEPLACWRHFVYLDPNTNLL